jgi:Reverse transcriptase (RNA-dependent DNA polymerase)
MFFGLTNSPANFQTMMNHLFRGLIAKGRIVVYMDNILIFTSTLEEHRRIVSKVLQILHNNKLYLKPEKCDFEQEEIEYLGLRIAYDKVMMDPVKVQGIADWPPPKTVTGVCSFLGFTNFYHQFIRGFADLA